MHADLGSAGAEDAAVVDCCGKADHDHECVEGELFGTARIVDDLAGPLLLVGSTNRTPPRRGAVTRSIASVTNAAFSGSSSATSVVMPSGRREMRRDRFSRNAASRSATPSASMRSRASRASAATRSGGRSPESSTSRCAAAARSSALTSAVGSPSPFRMAAVAPTDTSPVCSATATGAIHDASPSRASPAVIIALDSPTDSPVTDAINRSGVRAPVRCASPANPSSGRERRATSLATAAAAASTFRRAEAM